LGTVHHEYVFTVQEGLDAVPDVIYHLETYDVTTVRASTPMYLLSRKIKAMGVKMVLSGEGSDEILGGDRTCTRNCSTEAEFTQAISISMRHPMHVLSTKSVFVE
jgi:asparagine synthetase B (glutamine-hydrolysing)